MYSTFSYRENKRCLSTAHTQTYPAHCFMPVWFGRAPTFPRFAPHAGGQRRRHRARRAGAVQGAGSGARTGLAPGAARAARPRVWALQLSLRAIGRGVVSRAGDRLARDYGGRWRRCGARSPARSIRAAAMKCRQMGQHARAGTQPRVPRLHAALRRVAGRRRQSQPLGAACERDAEVRSHGGRQGSTIRVQLQQALPPWLSCSCAAADENEFLFGKLAGRGQAGWAPARQRPLLLSARLKNAPLFYLIFVTPVSRLSRAMRNTKLIYRDPVTCFGAMAARL